MSAEQISQTIILRKDSDQVAVSFRDQIVTDTIYSGVEFWDDWPSHLSSGQQLNLLVIRLHHTSLGADVGAKTNARGPLVLWVPRNMLTGYPHQFLVNIFPFGYRKPIFPKLFAGWKESNV